MVNIIFWNNDNDTSMLLFFKKCVVNIYVVPVIILRTGNILAYNTGREKAPSVIQIIKTKISLSLDSDLSCLLQWHFSTKL